MLFWIQISKYLAGAVCACSLGPSSNLFVNLEWGLIETVCLPDISSFIFISTVDWETVLKRDTRPRGGESQKDAFPGMPLTFAPPQNLISEPTNPDFWGNKSWRLREKSGLMLMQGAASWRTCPLISRRSMKDDTCRRPFQKSSHVKSCILLFFSEKSEHSTLWKGLWLLHLLHFLSLIKAWCLLELALSHFFYHNFWIFFALH